LRKGDKIFTYWGISVVVIWMSLVLLNIDSQLAYMAKYGAGSIVGEMVSFLIFLCWIPWGFYRLLRKSEKKQKELNLQNKS
jgi:membrane protein implicated in regulation of membrane protease activity